MFGKQLLQKYLSTELNLCNKYKRRSYKMEAVGVTVTKISDCLLDVTSCSLVGEYQAHGVNFRIQSS